MSLKWHCRFAGIAQWLVHLVANQKMGVQFPLPALNKIIMGLLFNNWLEEGYYEDDGFGDLTRIEDPQEIREAQKQGRLYENDGMATTKVGDEDINI